MPPTPAIDGPPIDWGQIDTIVGHYTAALDLPDGDPGEHADQLDDFLRGINKHYLAKGYSFAYNFIFDWLGGVWEGRGFDIKNAANKGWNTRSVSYLVLVDGQDGTTPEAAAAIRAMRAECNRRRGFALNLRNHSQVGSTRCWGDGLRAQQAAGLFELDQPTKPPPGVDKPDYANGEFGLQPYDTGKPVLRRGDRNVGGDKILYLQSVLKHKTGQTVVIDNDFGPQTEKAVKNVQAWNNVTVDGIVGWDGGNGTKPGKQATWPIIDKLALM